MTHSINSENGPFGQVVAVTGDADAHAAGALDEAIGSAAAAAENSTVIVDLLEANFVDSRTIGVLVTWSTQLRGAGGGLPIVCTDPNLLRLFRQIGVEESLHLVDSRASAAGAGA